MGICTTADGDDGVVPISEVREAVDKLFTSLSGDGFRILGVARRDFDANTIRSEDELGMTFVGMVVLADPPKPDARLVVEDLRSIGIALKMISGDNVRVAAHVGEMVGLDDTNLLTGKAIDGFTDDQLISRVGSVSIFAEVGPPQKARIIEAHRRNGAVVGYMGDGINDAPALHAADVGISVDTAVAVAREAADFVLLRNDLGVVAAGVLEGRRTFANTMKYILAATSANFGNMFSMAGASLLLPFLPLLPKQILLTNLFTDLPQMTIAADHVDNESLARPQAWNIRYIRRFMITFGALSSVFDYITFGALFLVLKLPPSSFDPAGSWNRSCRRYSSFS